MGTTVKVQYDNLPADAEVEVPYLGIFKNGESREVDDAEWDRFVTAYPQNEGVNTLELTTASAQEASEAYAQAAEAESLDELKKDQLAEIANASGIDDVKGKKKSELVEKLKEERPDAENK